MAKRNLVFLDFDGVLNSERSVVAYSCRGDHNKTAFDPEGLDEISVRLVRRLCEEAPAEVVISSSWRHFFPIEQIIKFLAAKGWPSAPIIGETPKYYRSDNMYGKAAAFRGNEIGGYLTEFVASGNELGNWVILDDSRDFHYADTNVGGFFSKQPIINTNDLLGITITEFWKALRILNPEHKLVTQLEYNATR